MDKLDKEIERIVKRFNSENSVYIEALCFTFEGTKFERLWDYYWKIINTENYAVIWEYFGNSSTNFENGFLRLLVLEDFKNYLRKQGVK